MNDSRTQITVLLTLLFAVGGFVSWLLYQTSVISKSQGRSEGAETWVKEWMLERTRVIQKVQEDIKEFRTDMVDVKKRLRLIEEERKHERTRETGSNSEVKRRGENEMRNLDPGYGVPPTGVSL